MRKTILLTVVTLAGVTSLLFADSAVEGPHLGYVSTKAGLRGVMGIVGASRLSDPISRDLKDAAVLPGSDAAVGLTTAGELIRVDLRDGSTINLGVEGATNIAASPSGEVVLAISADRARLFSQSGVRLADYALPGTPVRVSVSDRGSTAAVTVAEPDGEALFLISEQGVRRLLHAVRLPAMAFLPGSADFVIADDTGAIYRIGSDLQLIQITTAPGAKALAGTADGSRLLVVTEHRIDSIRFDTGDTRSIDCSCTAVAATPLQDATFLLTNPNDGPMWVVDASQTELRVAFIPGAVNE